jgi:hypothetical protein
LAQARFLGFDRLRGVEYVYLAAAVATIAYLIRRIVKRGARLTNLRAGYDAELAVGQELDALMRRGAVVFHDFPAEGFNIDHVVITKDCVYVVETKGYTKLTRLKGREAATVEFDGMRLKFPTWTTDEPILQAERQAKWFADWIKRASGHLVPVRPVVALPGWFVQQRGTGPVSVYSGRQLGSLLDTPKHELDPRTESVTYQVEQRCRTVIPTYKRDGSERP